LYNFDKRKKKRRDMVRAFFGHLHYRECHVPVHSRNGEATPWDLGLFRREIPLTGRGGRDSCIRRRWVGVGERWVGVEEETPLGSTDRSIEENEISVGKRACAASVRFEE
jgi:hypothetical protein